MIPIGILGLVILLIVVTLCLFLLLVGVKVLSLGGPRQRRQAAAMNLGPAQARPPLTVLPVERLPAPEPLLNSCPVCGASLPSDTPQGLCPRCLMQCALSNSDQPPPDEEGAETTAHPHGPLAPTPAELAPHFPDLEILTLLGQGGMGAVYQARQRKLDRLVALKVLPSEWGRDPAFAERFAREARAMARLSHPEVVGVHDFGEVGGHYYLIMEFVDGANLRQILAGGRLQPRQALSIVAQICDALQYAHEQGVVHRDIKPENILLDKRGRVKIADFGLAKLLRRSRSEFTLTGTGQVMGTLDYMAPEQRNSPQTVDHRADIYSLGVVFYEMLTGELPLGRFSPVSTKASVDGRLDEVIYRALEREPDRRYQRISAVKEDVESILRGQAPMPAATRRRPVRSFVHSMVSLFVPRSALGVRRGEAAFALAAPAPASARRARRLSWVVFGGALAWLLMMFAVLSLYRTAGGRDVAELMGRESQLEGIPLADLDELKVTLGLSDYQLRQLKQILANADREYLELEQRHTSRRTSREKDSVSHLLVTVRPFREEMSELEERVWAKLNAVVPSLTYDNYRKQLPPRGSLFAFGREEVTIELWQEGPWYHWKVMRSKMTETEDGSGTELPRRYQRFWQDGLP